MYGIVLVQTDSTCMYAYDYILQHKSSLAMSCMWCIYYVYMYLHTYIHGIYDAPKLFWYACGVDDFIVYVIFQVQNNSRLMMVTIVRAVTVRVTVYFILATVRLLK